MSGWLRFSGKMWVRAGVPSGLFSQEIKIKTKIKVKGSEPEWPAPPVLAFQADGGGFELVVDFRGAAQC